MENLTDLHGICLKVFEEVAKATSVFILPLFLGRIVFSNVIGEGEKSLQTFKGVVIYFLLIAGFPIILETLFAIPENFLPHWQGATPLSTEWNETPASGILPFSLDKIAETLLAALYWIAYYLHIFFMILMSAMAPVVFLLGSLLGVGIGLEIFMGLLILGSSWPILWFGFDQVHTLLARTTEDPFASRCLELLITLLKGLAPLTLASFAIKSPAGQIVLKSTKTLATAGHRGLIFTQQVMRPNPSTHSTSKASNYSSHPTHSSTSGLRKIERADFERLLGDRFRKPKSRGDS